MTSALVVGGRWLLGFVIAAGLAAAAVADEAVVPDVPGLPQFQSVPHTLSAADVLDASVLSGTNYKIKDVVTNDGFMNTYDVESTYGEFRVESTSMLYMRLNELDALDRMARLKGTSVYADAAKSAGKSPFTGAKDLVLSPVDTTKNVVGGIGKWLGDIGRAAVSNDPHQEGVIKTALGHASLQRKFAVEFGVDPYTSFKPLESELNDIAWTATGGGLTVKVAFAAIPGAAGVAVRGTSLTGGMQQLILDKSPGEIKKVLSEKFDSLGIESAISKAFLANPSYTPQEQVFVAAALEEMKGVAELRLLLHAASKAADEPTAVFNRVRIQHMAGLSAEKSVTRATLTAGVPFVQTADGEVIGVFPIDYLLWTSDLAMREKSVSTSIGDLTANATKHFRVLGLVHPTARRALEAAGWTVTDRIAY